VAGVAARDFGVVVVTGAAVVVVMGLSTRIGPTVLI
jgi:hypothetical protein